MLADMYDPRPRQAPRQRPQLRQRVPDFGGPPQSGPIMDPRAMPPNPGIQALVPDESMQMPPMPPPMEIMDPTSDDEWRAGFEKFMGGGFGQEGFKPPTMSPELLADYSHWGGLQQKAAGPRPGVRPVPKPPGGGMRNVVADEGRQVPPSAGMRNMRSVGGGVPKKAAPRQRTDKPAPRQIPKARDIKNKAMPKKGKPRIVR